MKPEEICDAYFGAESISQQRRGKPRSTGLWWTSTVLTDPMC
jgi:hypothetical protein